MVVKYGVLNSCRQSESPCSTSSLSTLWLHFLKDTLSVKWSPTNWAVLWECGQEYCNCTGSSQLSSFQIVYLISIVPYCGGGSRLISIYSLVRVPVGLLNYRSLSSTAWMWVKYMSCSNWVGFAQTLKVEAAAWLEGGSRVCDQCPDEVELHQNEEHTIWFCQDYWVCELRKIPPFWLHPFWGPFSSPTLFAALGQQPTC